MENIGLSIALGLLIGILSGIFGVSGGVFAVPLLGLLHFDEHLAQGTSLVMQLPLCIVGLWQYARRGTLDRRFVILLAVGAIPLTYVGATAATYMPVALLRRAFSLFLVLLASYNAWSVMRPRPLSEGSIARLHPGFYSVVSVVGAIRGFGSGFFGVGGASFAIPTLTLLFGLPQVRAQALGLALVFPAIVIAIPTYAHAGAVNWQSGLYLALGGVLSVPIGVGLAHRLPEHTLRLAFCGLLYLGALLLWEAA
jgi:uncharacterized membrane protein YfcA